MKMKWLQLMLLLAIIGVAGNAVADIAWTGAGSDDLWTNPDNWSLTHAPIDSDLNVFFNAGPDGGNDIVLVDSSTSVSLNCDLYGPEFGLLLDIDGGSLTQIYTASPEEGVVFAPVADAVNPSVVDVHNGGSLNVRELLLGDNWWFWTSPAVILNVYDTSTVTAEGWCWLGGTMNLYDGVVDIAGGFNMDSHVQGIASLNIYDGELIIRTRYDGARDIAAEFASHIENGYLTAYGLTPGRGADIIIDTTSIVDGLIVSAVYNYPATNPVPADESTGVGTPVTTDLVDVTLNWWCGADPNGPVNPNILTHYINISDGSDTDPNVYYNGDFVNQTSLTDPNNSYLMTNLFENTLYYWSIEEGIDDGTGTPYPAGDPNNILGPIWSFTTKAAQPSITDPVNDIADPDATFSVTEENGVVVTYQWYKVGSASPLTDTGAYSGTQTSTLTVADATISEEGQYYCVASNGPKTDTSEAAWLWTQRLMGHWKFEQNMQDSVADTEAGASVHDGAIGQNTVAGPGDANYAIAGGPDGSDAMEFNDDGDYVAIGGDPNFFNFYPLGFTASFWYKVDSPILTDGWRLPLSKLDAGIGGWLFGIDAGAREWALFFTNPDDTVDLWADGYIDMNGDGQNDINIGDGQWHMITAIYNPDPNTYTIFTDGDENESIVYDLADNPLPEAPLSIGGRITENSVDGFIDDVRIYSYSMTPLEIAQLYLAVETDAWVCVEDPEDPLGAFDTNGDCRINLTDFAEFALAWLKCQRVPDTACSN